MIKLSIDDADKICKILRDYLKYINGILEDEASYKKNFIEQYGETKGLERFYRVMNEFQTMKENVQDSLFLLLTGSTNEGIRG